MSASQRVSRFRLNGWQRIGIVLSVVWIIVGSYLAYGTIEAQLGLQEICADYPEANLGFCSTSSVQRRGSPTILWIEAGISILAPILIAWLMAYALIYLARWIRAGFR